MCGPPADAVRRDGQPRSVRPQDLVLGSILAATLALITPLSGWAQQAPPESAAPTQVAPPAPVATVAGGTLHGVITSGKVPLPGVAVTAKNTLTGKSFATTTDINGAWSMTIPQNGRYVIRTDFAAFAPSTHEALFNANSHDSAVNFDLTLASRAAQQDASDQQQGAAQQAAAAMRQLGAGAQSLSLMSSLAAGTDAAEGGTSSAGAALPEAANSNASGSDSVAITGQSGSVSPLAGIDPDRIRDAIATIQAQGGNGGGFFGGPGFGGGGGFGGFGGGRGNFRNFRADQPHGAVYWNGNNSALNALPFAVSGQQEAQPDYGSNNFGLTFIGEPYLPQTYQAQRPKTPSFSPFLSRVPRCPSTSTLSFPTRRTIRSAAASTHLAATCLHTSPGPT